MNRNRWLTSHASPRRLAALAAVLSLTLGAATQCGTDPASSPWAHCPHHEHRVKGMGAPASLTRPWVCVR